LLLLFFRYFSRYYSVSPFLAGLCSISFVALLVLSYLPLSITMHLLRQSLASAILLLALLPSSSSLVVSTSVYIPVRLLRFRVTNFYFSSLFCRLLLLFIACMLHFSMFFFLPLAYLVALFVELKISFTRFILYSVIVVALTLGAFSPYVLSFLASIYMYATGSSVILDKINLYIYSFYSMVQYPPVSYRGIVLLLLVSLFIALSLSRSVFVILLLPILAVVISLNFPQGTVLSHRFYQYARFLSCAPLMVVFSAFCSFVLTIPRRRAGVASTVL